MEPEWVCFESHNSVAFDALNLLREVDLAACLPAAFVLASAPEFSLNLFSGLERVDKSRSMLSPENQAALVIGRDRITNDLMGFLNSWSCASTDCVSPRNCAIGKGEMLQERLTDEWWTYAGHALVPWSDLAKPGQQSYPGFCPACSEEYEWKYLLNRHNIWDRIPTYFGLESWEKLLSESE